MEPAIGRREHPAGLLVVGRVREAAMEPAAGRREHPPR